jgi:hypothetical protein
MAILSYEGGFLTNEELSYRLNASQGQKKQGELERTKILLMADNGDPTARIEKPLVLTVAL